MLQLRVAASTGAACPSGIPEPSHVLRTLGRGAEQADSSIRLSFGRFTIDAKIERAVHLVVEVLEPLG